MDHLPLKSQILDQIRLPEKDRINLVSVQLIARSEVEVPHENWITDSRPIIDDEYTFSDEYAVYLLFVNRIDIYQTVKVWINETDYELITRFTKEVRLKIPALKMEINGKYHVLGLLDSNGRILLLKLNGDFLGTIMHPKIKFSTFTFGGRYAYVGTEWCSVLVYDLTKLKFTDTTFDIVPHFAQSYKNCCVAELRYEPEENLLFYGLNDSTKGHIDLREKERRVEHTTGFESRHRNRARFIHTLSATPEHNSDELLSFCTVTKSGTLQKYWKQEEEFQSAMFYLLNDTQFLNTKLTKFQENDRVTSTYLARVPFRGRVYDDLYVGTRNGFLVKFSFETDSIEYVSLVNDDKVICIESYHSNHMKSVDTFLFVL